MTIVLTKQQIIRAIESEVYRLLGRHYSIELEVLDPGSLRELRNMLSDLDTEMHYQRRLAHIG
jgi:hypothetical protein